jgi:iron complex outermembrane receptor protein
MAAPAVPTRRLPARTAVAGAVLALAASAATAQTTQTITVTGIRGAIESAISVKKNADSIVEAISAEDIGKLPDTSVAESLSRLPGVAAQRTAGRAQQISIRGLGPDFSTALLNGREQVTTGDSRGVEFDQYPSELLNGVLIYKTPDGALLGQGLSGTVDMQTIRPLDHGKRAFAVNYRKQHTGVGLPKEGRGDRFSLAYVDQFADRTLGIALGFARFTEDGAQSNRFEAWGVADSAFGGETVKTPGGFNAWQDQTTQTRDGAMATVQYKPNKAFASTLDLFYGKFDKNKATKGFQAPIGFDSAGGYDPGTTGLSAATVSNGVATAGSFDNFKGVIRNDSEYTEDELNSIGWNNRLTMGGWTGTVDLSRSKAKRRGGIVETTAGTPGPATATGSLDTISWTGFNGSDVGGARYSTGLNYADRATVSLTDVMGWGGGPTLPQAGYSKLPFVDDKLDAFRVSATTVLPEGWWFIDADIGFNHTDRRKDRAFVEGRLVIPGGDPYGTAPIPGSGSTTINGIPVATWDPAGSVGPVYEIAAKLVRDIANKDWTVKEKVSTAYAKLNLDSTLFGRPLRGNAGLQLVHTDQSSNAFSVDNAPCPDDVCPVLDNSGGTTYSDVLPSLNLVLDLGNDQNLRLGVSRTLARPTINDMRASVGFGINATAPGGPRLEGDAGNPELEPFRANAIDLSYEKYFGTRAYFGAAVFYKDLKTYIVRSGRVFDFADFLSPGASVPPGGAVGILTQPTNGSGGSIQGLELAASLPFSMLTPALEGFGIALNYAYNDSSVKLPTAGFSATDVATPTISLPGLSRDTAGLTFYYERYGFSARLASRYRSDFIGEVTDFAGDRQLTRVRGENVVDLQIGYEFQSGIAKGLSVLFQASNLTNERYIRYRDTPDNKVEDTEYGKTYLLGLNYKL